MKINTTIAFILHPLNVDEFKHKKYFYSPFELPIDLFLKFLPPNVVKRFYSSFPPHVFMEVNDLESQTGSKVRIIGIMCPLFPEEFFINSNFAFKKILRAVNLAIKAGCNIVVLGGFTSIIGNQGKEMKELIKNTSLTLTTGNTFTAGLCLEGINKAAKLFNRDIQESTIAIIGATGDIGSICAKLLAQKSKRIFLCSRNIEENMSLVQEIQKCAKAIVNIEKNSGKALKNADIIILATSSFMPVVSMEELKPFTIICDVSLPHNVDKEVVTKRKDVFVFDGGKAKLWESRNGISGKWKEFTFGNSVYGCLAEGLILGFENRFEDFSIGRGNITVDKMEQILLLGKKHGIELAEFAFWDRPYNNYEINEFRKTFGVLN